MNYLSDSELILNEDGSIYHLNLLPEQIATTIILVGDPDRVGRITRHFDTVELVVKKREFHTQTGTYKGKRMTVLSTGIGTDNIDIVLNELDALVNIDLENRRVKEKRTQLDIIRIGTSGSIQSEIPIDAIVLSRLSAGFDSLLHFYQSDRVQLGDYNEALDKHMKTSPHKSKPYVVECDPALAEKFASPEVYEGFTATNVGFYAPQGRVLRLPLNDDQFQDRISSFNYKGKKITNLEMETSGILGLSKLLGHRAISLNAIIANRATGEFSKQSAATVEKTIRFALEKLRED